jgi:hypothetical protein
MAAAHATNIPSRVTFQNSTSNWNFGWVKLVMDRRNCPPQVSKLAGFQIGQWIYVRGDGGGQGGCHMGILFLLLLLLFFVT